MLKHSRGSGSPRVIASVLLIGALSCSFSAAADNWTSSALIGNIQSSSDGANSSTAHFFKVKGAPTWSVPGSACPSPTFVYITSSLFGYRELLATAMLAKALGKPVAFLGACNGTDYLVANYVILAD